MTNELEKQFFDTFGIEPCVRDWNQYNFAQIKRGLEIFPERQKLADEGYIKITQKMLNPRPENDCVYWEEYQYPPINSKKLLELICIALNTFEKFEVNRLMNIDSLKEKILKLLMLAQDDVYKEVQTVFKEK